MGKRRWRLGARGDDDAHAGRCLGGGDAQHLIEHAAGADLETVQHQGAVLRKGGKQLPEIAADKAGQVEQVFRRQWRQGMRRLALERGGCLGQVAEESCCVGIASIDAKPQGRGLAVREVGGDQGGLAGPRRAHHPGDGALALGIEPVEKACSVDHAMQARPRKLCRKARRRHAQVPPAACFSKAGQSPHSARPFVGFAPARLAAGKLKRMKHPPQGAESLP